VLGLVAVAGVGVLALPGVPVTGVGAAPAPVAGVFAGAELVEVGADVPLLPTAVVPVGAAPGCVLLVGTVTGVAFVRSGTCGLGLFGGVCAPSGPAAGAGGA
jgi:hypothetical protein